jgi:hypothetical protein
MANAFRAPCEHGGLLRGLPVFRGGDAFALELLLRQDYPIDGLRSMG